MPLQEDATTKRVPQKETRVADRQLLDKWQVEEMTSVEITRSAANEGGEFSSTREGRTLARRVAAIGGSAHEREGNCA
jgi:hypothetical protein